MVVHWAGREGEVASNQNAILLATRKVSKRATLNKYNLEVSQVRGGGFPQKQKSGAKKHLWVVLHRVLEREGLLSRNFSLEYRWTKNGEETARTPPQCSMLRCKSAMRCFRKRTYFRV